MCRTFSLSVVITVAVAASACFIEPTNPCDPATDPDVQAQGTRIAGVVRDQDGAPLSGVPVAISGRAETQVSGAQGEFAFANVPPAASYEIVALPAPPLVGGRAPSAPVTCGAQLEGQDVVVIVPPDSPEVELVRATSETRLFAAFGAVGDAAPLNRAQFFDDPDDATRARNELEVATACNLAAADATLRYRVQVRAPFDVWRDAVLAPFPWADPLSIIISSEGGESVAQYHALAVEDTCAAALCAQFEYLEPDLADERARCAEVAGIVADDGSIQPLGAYGSYQVRVLTELKVDDAKRQQFALPERVVAAAPASTQQMSLVPSALLPVVDATGAPRAVGRIAAIVPAAGGRFALVEDDALRVFGDGADVLDEAGEGNVASGDAPQGAFGEDSGANTTVTNDFADDVAPSEDAQPIALLPAGDWLRVVRRVDATNASIEKVYLGKDSAAARSGPEAEDALANTDEPQLTLDPQAAAAGTALRAFSYLTPDPGPLLQEGVRPPDAYLMLYGSAFVLVEQGAPAEMLLGFFAAEAPADPDTGELFATEWASSTEADVVDGAAHQGACAGFDGALRKTDLDGNSNIDARAQVAVCYDLAAARGEEIDLRDVDILPTPDGAHHVLADAANDRVLIAPTNDLTCRDCNLDAQVRLSSSFLDVRVGREPVALLRSAKIQCDAALDRKPVVLVANHGSGDLSVLERDENGEVRETSVVSLPTFPLGFLEDPDGPSCEDPFVWILGDDGRAVPVDMRGEPSVPLCQGASCDVGTRGRGSVGALARRAGPARALVGGAGLLGELGFFRPKALKGDAFRDDVIATPAAP